MALDELSSFKMDEMRNSSVRLKSKAVVDVIPKRVEFVLAFDALSSFKMDEMRNSSVRLKSKVVFGIFVV